MPFTDNLRIGSLFVEPRNRPARFNPQRIRIRIREFSTQLTGKRRIFRPLFQPIPKIKAKGQRIRSRLRLR